MAISTFSSPQVVFCPLKVTFMASIDSSPVMLMVPSIHTMVELLLMTRLMALPIMSSTTAKVPVCVCVYMCVCVCVCCVHVCVCVCVCVYVHECMSS